MPHVGVLYHGYRGLAVIPDMAPPLLAKEEGPPT
jgi:hypothetical protein